MRSVSIFFLSLLTPYICRNMVTRMKHGPFELLGSVTLEKFTWQMMIIMWYWVGLWKEPNQTKPKKNKSHSTALVPDIPICVLVMRFSRLAVFDHTVFFKPTWNISPHSDSLADHLSEPLTASQLEGWYTLKNSKKTAANSLLIPVLTAAPRVTQRSLLLQWKVLSANSCLPGYRESAEVVDPARYVYHPSKAEGTLWKRGQEACKSQKMGWRATKCHSLG